MRTLKFIVEGLSIKKDPDCDFSGIVPGTKGYIQAEFDFDHDWSGCGKMVVFTKQGSQEQVPVRLTNNVCMIPDEVLARRKFKLKVIGIKTGLRLVTNNLEVNQNG